MRLTTLGTRLDTRVGDLAERASRGMTRRQVMRTAVVGGATGIASLSIGVNPALASCASNCGPTRRCSNCQSHNCPSGYSLCKGCSTCNCFNNQGYRCEYPSGYWIACSGLGRGYGYETCLDCIRGGNCSGWCTCLTACSCCQCQSPEDVVAEQKRMQHLIHA